MNNTPQQKSVCIAMLTVLWFGIMAMVLLSSCSTTSNASKHQNHLKSSPQHNFKHNDNGGCNWHSN